MTTMNSRLQHDGKMYDNSDVQVTLSFAKVVSGVDDRKCVNATPIERTGNNADDQKRRQMNNTCQQSTRHRNQHHFRPDEEDDGYYELQPSATNAWFKSNRNLAGKSVCLCIS